MAQAHIWQTARLFWGIGSGFPVLNNVLAQAIFHPPDPTYLTVLRVIADVHGAAMVPTRDDQINPKPPVDAWPQLNFTLNASFSETGNPDFRQISVPGANVLGFQNLQLDYAPGPGTDLEYAIMLRQAVPLDVKPTRKGDGTDPAGPTVAVWVRYEDPGQFFWDPSVSTYAARVSIGGYARVLWGQSHP
jgi:hypothetical protein